MTGRRAYMLGVAIFTALAILWGFFLRTPTT